jgi:hypothetical protein
VAAIPTAVQLNSESIIWNQRGSLASGTRLFMVIKKPGQKKAPSMLDGDRRGRL